jgi:hypothetical protein
LLKALLRIIAAILLAFFVLAFPASLVMRDVGALIFDPATTQTLVRDHLLDSELIAGLAEQATQELLLSGSEAGAEQKSVTGSLIQNSLDNLSDEDWKQITDYVAPSALVEQTVNEVVTAYTDWLDSDQDMPALTLDLSTWKANAEANAPQVMAIVLDAMPPCTAEQVGSMALDALNSAEGLLQNISACNPPEPFYSAIVNNANLLLQASLRTAPDSVDISQLGQTNGAPNELTQLKTNLGQVRTVLNWSWVAVAGIGALAVVAGAAGFKSALRWAGWPLLAAGNLALVFGLALQLFSLQFLDSFLSQPLMAEAGAVGALGRAIAGGALDLVSKPLLLQGLLMIALGAGSVYAAGLFAKREASPGIPLNQRRIGL